MQQAPLQSGQLVRHTSLFRRMVWAYYILLALLLAALLPPLISVDRLQRRIATSISRSVGRPVHLDNVSLSLLPTPGFILQNLVVSEDPAFGSEPIIRANTVRATLRLSSLWSRRVEFSSISFTEPSVNLVHLPNGKWNLESILLQAAHIAAAPTAQAKSGPAPRFPYIEATGARLNLKMGLEKTPYSLTEADFALWLPNPQQWRLRLEGRPARTDTSASDTGIFRLEGTLGRASTLELVPIDLNASWLAAPLGETSILLLGRDANLRGDMALTAHALGTVGDSALTTRLQFSQVRRADFVPPQPLNLDLTCTTHATSAFHSFPDIHCAWPSTHPAADDPAIVLDAALPDIRLPRQFTATADATKLPASSLLDWLRVASARVPSDTVATGQLTAHLTYALAPPPATSPAPSSPSALPAKHQPLSSMTTQKASLTGTLQIATPTVANPGLHLSPIRFGDLLLQSVSAPASARSDRRKPAPAPASGTGAFTLDPTTLALGGKEPATLEARFDDRGYTLHLSGMIVLARLQALAEALPHFGDGLNAVLPDNRAAGPIRLDLTAARPWFGPQSWQILTDHPAPPHPHKNR